MTCEVDSLTLKDKHKKILIAVAAVLAFVLGSLGNYFFIVTSYNNDEANKGSFENYLHAMNTPFLSSFTDNQLMQKLLDAIQPKANIRTIYLSIPIYQLNGLTYEEFSQYSLMLANFSSGHYNTFSAMTTSDREQLQKRIINNSPDYASIAKNSSYFWLENASDSDLSNRIPVVIQKNIQGDAYFSRTWVTRSLDLFAFANLYISALRNKDEHELSLLMTGDSNSKAIRDKKADMIMSYYENHSVSWDKDLKVTSFRMDEIQMSVKLSAPLDDNGGAVVTVNRSMSIISPAPNTFEVHDEAPMELTNKDFTIQKGNDYSFLIGDYIKNADVEKYMGKPVKITANPLPGWINYDGNVKLMNIEYPEATLQVIGIQHDDLSWEGIVRSATIFSNVYQTGAGLAPGQTLDDVLLKYPFMDLHDYILVRNDHELYVGTKDGRVHNVRVTDRRFDRQGYWKSLSNDGGSAVQPTDGESDEKTDQ